VRGRGARTKSATGSLRGRQEGMNTEVFPHRLRLAAAHAESLCIVLSRLPQGRSTHAGIWLMGRRQEVSCFVDQVGRDYRARKVDEAAAVAAINAYLAAVHAGLATHFRIRSPGCCHASSAITVTAPRPADNTPTTFYVRRAGPPLPRPVPTRRLVPRPAPRPVSSESGTWLDVEPDERITEVGPSP
jgi:hypothetical protein